MTGGLIESPAAVSWGDDRIDVFTRLASNSMWHRYWNGSHWSTWEEQGGQLASPVAVSSWGKRRLDCFALGPDGQLWHKWFDDGWKQWESLGHPMTGKLIEAPTAVSWGDDRIDCFARLQKLGVSPCRYYRGARLAESTAAVTA